MEADVVQLNILLSLSTMGKMSHWTPGRLGSVPAPATHQLWLSNSAMLCKSPVCETEMGVGRCRCKDTAPNMHMCFGYPEHPRGPRGKGMVLSLGSEGSASSLQLWVLPDLVVLKRAILPSDHTLPRTDRVYLEDQWRYTSPTILAPLISRMGGACSACSTGLTEA